MALRVNIFTVVRGTETYPFILSLGITIQGIIFAVSQSKGMDALFAKGCSLISQFMWPGELHSGNSSRATRPLTTSSHLYRAIPASGVCPRGHIPWREVEAVPVQRQMDSRYLSRLLRHHAHGHRACGFLQRRRQHLLRISVLVRGEMGSRRIHLVHTHLYCAGCKYLDRLYPVDPPRNHRDVGESPRLENGILSGSGHDIEREFMVSSTSN